MSYFGARPVESGTTNSGSIAISASRAPEGWERRRNISQMMCPIRSRRKWTVVSAGYQNSQGLTLSKPLTAISCAT